MTQNEVDLFSIINLFNTLSHICFTLSVSTEGTAENWRVVITKRNIVLFSLKLIFVTILYLIYIYEKLKNTSTLKLLDIPYYFCLLSYFVFCCFFFGLQIYNKDKIISVYNDLKRLVYIMKTYKILVNFILLKKYIFIILTVQIISFLMLLSDFLIVSSEYLSIIYFIVNIMIIFSVTELWFLLSLICVLVKDVKQLAITKTSLNISIYDKLIKKLMTYFLDLLDLCLKINRLFDFFIIPLFMACCILIYFAFKLVVQLPKGWYDIFGIYDTIVWLIVNYITALVIICLYAYTKNQVRNFT